MGTTIHYMTYDDFYIDAKWTHQGNYYFYHDNATGRTMEVARIASLPVDQVQGWSAEELLTYRDCLVCGENDTGTSYDWFAAKEE